MSEIRQVWSSCTCCLCEHPTSNMKFANKNHEKYHDCVINETICPSCFAFIATDNLPFCPHAHNRNLFAIATVPICLKLGFLEQRAITLTHCYMSILIIRGRQNAMKGQLVHCQADVTKNIGDLLPFPECYQFMAVVQQKPTKDHNEIRSTVRYSVSAKQILNALEYLVGHHKAYANKRVLSLDEIESMFQSKDEELAPIRIIDSYAYNNCTTSSPIILDPNDELLGPWYQSILLYFSEKRILLNSRTLEAAEDAIWQIESGLEESTFPWIYPTGERGELDNNRPIKLKLRDYYKLRLMSHDKRWQSDAIWAFRAMNLIQRDDLRKAVNYHAKKQFKKERICYNIYPCKNKKACLTKF